MGAVPRGSASGEWLPPSQAHLEPLVAIELEAMSHGLSQDPSTRWPPQPFPTRCSPCGSQALRARSGEM